MPTRRLPGPLLAALLAATPLLAQNGEAVDLPPAALERTLARTLREVSAVTVVVSSWGRMGSGTIVEPDGHVLTCAHVVQGRRRCTVTLSDGRRYRGRVLGVNGAGDLALVKVEAEGLPAARLGDPGGVRLRQWVVGAGHSVSAFYDLQPSTGVGITRSLNRTVTAGRDTRLVNTIVSDVPMAPGASGGGLYDLEGRLVGVINAVDYREYRTYSVRVSEYLADRDRMKAGEAFDRGAETAYPPTTPVGRSWSRRHYFGSHLAAAARMAELRQVRLQVESGEFTGTLVSPEGDVLTVLDPVLDLGPGGTVKARLPAGDGETEAVVVAKDFACGIALLRLPARGAPYPCFDLDEGAVAAQGRLVVCKPRRRVHGGIVVAADRWPPIELTSGRGRERFFGGVAQVDLRLYESALGAPVVDAAGELVGIVVQYRLQRTRFGRRRGVVGAFGALVLEAPELRESHAVLHRGETRAHRAIGYMGVQLRELTEEQKRRYGVRAGVVVASIPDDSPSARAGLRRDDIILSVAGHPVNTFGALLSRVASRDAGDRVPVVVHRDGAKLTFRVTLGRRESR